jgi:hypothetical protein
MHQRKLINGKEIQRIFRWKEECLIQGRPLKSSAEAHGDHSLDGERHGTFLPLNGRF